MLHLRLFGAAEIHSDDGRDLRSVLSQPKRLALLAYLAAARQPGFHRRDTLLGLLWPELDQQHGRAALRQVLYTLRQVLGSDVILTRGDNDLAINPEKLSCDVVSFRNRLSSDPAGAAELYAGDLLNGFFVNEAPEFERWLEEERWLLRREAASAAWRVAEFVRESDLEAAANWAARAAGLDPFNEEAVRRLMRLLAEGGHRASALQLYQNFARLLERELETAPSHETEQLAESLRITPKTNGNGHAHLDVGTVPAMRKRSRIPMLFPVAAVAVIALLTVLTVMRFNKKQPTIAIGAIHGDAALRDMIATSIARVAGIQVVSNTRILELTRGDTSAAAVASAARRAGAQRILEGRVDRTRSGRLRLDLQWQDLRTGRVRPAAQVVDNDALALADAATTAIANELELDAPTIRFAEVSTHSLQAYRYFEEGLRAFSHDERVSAERLWRKAVEEDSTFAIALWYLSRLHDIDFKYTQRALRHAEHATDRERLFIRASFFSQMDDPRAAAVAETLAIRYPAEPDGHFLLGFAKLWSGNPLGAIPHFRTVVRMDTASLADDNVLRCRACDALGEISTALSMADSGAAVLRFGKEWLRAQPNARGAWAAHVIGYETIGQYDKAIAARRSMNQVPPADYSDLNVTETFMRAGDFAAADAMLLDRIRNGPRDVQANAQLKYSLSLRNQGRFAEAIHAAREFWRLNDDPTPIYSRGPEAWALMDAGKYSQALIIFDSMAHKAFTPLSPARNARTFVGGLARVAEAAAALNDTIRIKQVIDSMRVFGQFTSFAPARQNHHFARGLLLSKRADHEGAAREFAAALAFPVNISTRIHLHLYQELMALGRPRDAALVVGKALRTSVGGAGYGVTHRELHTMASRAWRAAGAADSARVHEDWLRRIRR